MRLFKYYVFILIITSLKKYIADRLDDHQTVLWFADIKGAESVFTIARGQVVPSGATVVVVKCQESIEVKVELMHGCGTRRPDDVEADCMNEVSPGMRAEKSGGRIKPSQDTVDRDVIV